MKALLAMWCFVVLGCVHSDIQACSDGRLCPAGTVCDDVHTLCVSQTQLDGCQGQADGTTCQFAAGSGECNQGVCLTAVCGDGIVELPEICDDGNTRDEDLSIAMRCSSNCESTEICGNGIVDLATGERCDDGNLLDHDGCSSACQPETLLWSRFADPKPEYAPVAALDASRGRVVLYSAPSGALAPDTDEWDGLWRGSIPTLPPGPPRRFPAMAAFGPHHAIILQGGGLAEGPDGQTWEWNGTLWTRLANGPVLQEHAMAYDDRRQRIVLFGGDDGGKGVADTWEFDGTAWTKLSPPNSPGARYDLAMAYDPARGVVVMFGGKDNNGTYLTDTWEYDGQTWTVKNTGMAVVRDSPLAYSSKAHGVVMVGGFNSGGTGTNTMYVWSGTTWTATSTAIPVRGYHALAETGDGGLLVFGGASDTSAATLRPDTWLYDGLTWSTAPTPLPRLGLEAVATRHGVVAFGGTDGASYPPGTWELTAHHGWTVDNTGGPSGRFLSPLAYDETRDVVVLFGGAVNGSTPDDTTWQRTGTSWTSTRPTPSPSPRAAHTLAYDLARKQIVLFGGTVAGAPSGDTWTFDGTSWTQHTLSTSPPARTYASMTYDRVNDVVILFGGVDAGSLGLDDTWAWNGSQWTEITPPGDRPLTSLYARQLIWVPALHSAMLLGGATGPTIDAWQLVIGTGSYRWVEQRTLGTPPTRVFTAAFMAPDQAGAIIFGGSDGMNSLLDAEMIGYQGPLASDTCSTASDLDGDGLTLCADPDCWRVCEPLCPPATSCPSTAPRCGDGTCDPSIETCHNCPADCTGCTPVCGDGICDAGETCPGDCP